MLATAAVWGVTFVVQKDIGALPPLAFVAARFAVSALALAPFALFEARRAKGPAAKSAWPLALVIGALLFLGASLQQAGLRTTSATNGGFLTASYVVLTPLVVWALSRKPLRAIVLVAGAVSLFGAFLLATGGGPAQPPTLGDGLVLIADVAWAAQIALVAVFLARAGRPLTLAFVQYATTAGLAAAFSFAFERANPADVIAATPEILFAGLFAGALGYTLAIIGQRRTPPAEAALILSLESGVRGDRGRAFHRRAADACRRGRMRADPDRRGRGRGGAGVCERGGRARVNAAIRRGRKASPCDTCRACPPGLPAA